jgi:hypothetical protein
MRRRTWSVLDVLSPSPNIAPAGEGGEGYTGPASNRGGEGGEGVNSISAGGEGGEGDMSAAHVGGEGGGEGSVSDIRLKEDIASIGSTAHGLPLYRFRYKGGDDLYSGVMAQDVLKVMPEAVTVGREGFYRVNYAMLGIKMERLN